MATAATLDTQRRIADMVNGSIKLPVGWRSVKREGRFATVHVQVQQGFQAGRLRRRRDDLLCGSRGAAVEAAWACDGAGREYQQEVTCKACLERARVLSTGAYVHPWHLNGPEK